MSEKNQPSTARSSGKIMLAIFGSRILGLVREIVLSAIFGPSLELDALKVAFRIPNLLRDLFAEGALSTAFVTTFSQTLTRDGKAAAFRLANLVLTALVISLGLITLAGILGSDWIVRTMTPGFLSHPGKVELTVQLTQIMFPFILFVSLAALYMGLLNSLGSFGLPASASTAFNVVSILVGAAMGYCFDHHFGPKSIFGFAIGVLLGGVAQLLIQMPRARQYGYHLRWVWAPRDPGLRKVLILMAPAVIGGSAVQVNVLVNSYFASFFGNGAVTWLDNAFRLMQLPIGMFGVAISMVTLPSVSRSAARDNLVEFRHKLQEGLRHMFFLVVPASVGLALISRPLVAALFQRHFYTAADAAQTAQILQYYTLGLAGYAAIKVLAPAFYALDLPRIPLQVSLGGIALNICANLFFLKVLHWGLISLPLSTSLVALFNCLQLVWYLRKPVGSMTDRPFLTALAKILLATAVMAAVLWLVHPLLRHRAFVLQVAVLCLCGGAAYFSSAWLLRLEEVKDLATLLQRRLVRR